MQARSRGGHQDESARSASRGTDCCTTRARPNARCVAGARREVLEGAAPKPRSHQDPADGGPAETSAGETAGRNRGVKARLAGQVFDEAGSAADFTGAVCRRCGFGQNPAARWRRPRIRARKRPPTSGASSCTRRCRSGRVSCSRRCRGSRTSRSATPDTVEVDVERDLGFPGVFPFTRGVYPSMYRGRLWTMRQFAGFGTAEETNERFRYLLEHGQTGLSTAFDMPTLMGYDSDHARSLGEVGREGVAIDSLEDMETLFAGHPARRGLDVDDDQLAGGDLARVLRVRRRGAGRLARPAARDDPDGHPQGVHRAEGVHLPAGAEHAARDGHGRVLLAGDAAVASDLDQRLPHPRGGLDGGAGARVHARRRLHLCRVGDRARPRRRRLRAAVVVLLQRASRLLRGDREVPRGAADLGDADARQVRRRRTRAPG